MPTASGPMAGLKAVMLADENLVVYFFKFDNITCNASILVLNGFFAMISCIVPFWFF